MQEVAHEENECVQKLKTSVATVSNYDHSVMVESDIEEDETESRQNIWQVWKKFLNNAQNNNNLLPLSPEKHSVIWYGVDLRRCLYLPEGLYTRMRYETTAIKQYNISNNYKEVIKNIIQLTNRNQILESIEVLRSAECSAVEKKALVDFFLLFGEGIYDDVGDALFESEACFSSNLIKTCLKTYSHMLRNKGHWTMMTPESGVYIMTKEQKATIPVNINSMTDDLISYVRFHLNLTELVTETLDSIEDLQKEHQSQIQ
ncbi:hypothetical protein G6F37_004828 [Rhizopus arrhizus]|nr:hypothetical protein G6F38_001345 [Rhizopus arrhizus]KAG1159507.1 hypothetical protein G6F37_004828 [Rhizopus arrhizus]